MGCRRAAPKQLELTMASSKIAPEDKYNLAEGRVYVSGNQALVRLPIEQARRDRAAGLNTAGFISGYRGSPLGHLDQDFTRVKPLLETLDIRFQPGANAVWGTQQIGFFDPRFDGVFGMWYSKGPGIDRSGDALRHANLWGTAPKGGVIMAVGDDPMARSSSIQQQSEHTLASMCIPTFSAANVQDIYDFGLIGWQLSRHAGTWAAIKGVSDIYESWLAIDVDPARTAITIPADPGKVHTRWPDRSVDQDERMLRLRLPAAREFARLNRLNRTTHAAKKRRLGIVTAGKSWSDTVEALADLGIDEAQLAAAGVEVFKVALIWPLEAETLREFAAGLEEVLVIEESRPFLEPQVKDIVCNLMGAPRVLGKRDAEGAEWLPSHGELNPVIIARVLHRWLALVHRTEAMDRWIAYLDQVDTELARPRSNVIRSPYFCSGCPHNTSTRIPEGSKQLAGIGCHWMVNLMDRETISYPQMGGEGANWAGAAHFLNDEHIFVNIGDGTWYHSGTLAIRQAVASGVSITYKILYNDAVAMTGGQPVDGPLSVAQITHELRGEAVAAIAVVSSDPDKFDPATFSAGTKLYHRDELEAVQKAFRETPGVTVIVYEQTCATELRRRRGKKLAPDPARRVVINERVCEGCGDCSVQSNCLSVQPLETEFGRKRTIDQSACNKDFSCLKGFCPSFVTLEGAEVAKPKGVKVDAELFANLPEPGLCEIDGTFGLMVTGIGGTGVVTISNLIGSAAQAEGKAVQALDLTGLAQKFGAVQCHLKIAHDPALLKATRLSVGQCDVLIGADIVTSAADDALARLRTGHTRAVINDHEAVTGAFTEDRDFSIPIPAQRAAIERFCGEGRAIFLEATALARKLTGNTIGTNIMLLGFASQQGWLPVRVASLEGAIEANGVAVAANLEVFRLGRLLAHDPATVAALAEHGRAPRASQVLSESVEQAIARRVGDLTAYQDAAYASRYSELVDRVAARESEIAPGSTALTEAVARNYYKVLAYKDEYEVARLYTDTDFLRSVRDEFAGDFRITFHLAPPFLPGLDQRTGRPRKRTFGPWMLTAFGLLKRFKFLRGSRFDPFGYSAERRAERTLIAEYEDTVATIIASLARESLEAATVLASWPDLVRGFGPVKEQSIEQARKERTNRAARMCEHAGEAMAIAEDTAPTMAKARRSVGQSSKAAV
jgi:indolepyruvate ferredoxin oxidoreductase